MLIAVPKETLAEETRVALVPKHVALLKEMGFEINIERGAGTSSGFSDDEYEASGAKICPSPKETFTKADLIFKIWAPTEKEAELFTNNQTVICNAQNIKTFQELQILAKSRITLFALDLMPRISRAQDMDILSSQNNLAGYTAVILGAGLTPAILPLLITSAGTLPPTKILVMGLGVAGLQAVATAHRLGAQVYAYDNRPETEEQAASLGAVFVHELTEGLLSSVRLIITSALISGKPAPKLLKAKQLKFLPPDCVIIDMAAESGGNIPISKSPTNLKIIQDSYLARRTPYSASQLFSGNMFNFCRFITPQPDIEDEIIKAVTICREGKIYHPYLKKEKNNG